MLTRNAAALVIGLALASGPLSFTAKAADAASQQETMAWRHCLEQTHNMFPPAHHDFDRQIELSMKSCLSDNGAPNGTSGSR